MGNSDSNSSCVYCGESECTGNQACHPCAPPAGEPEWRKRWIDRKRESRED